MKYNFVKKNLKLPNKRTMNNKSDFYYLILKYLQGFLKVFNFLIDEFTETLELKCRWDAAPVFEFVLKMLKCWDVKCVHLGETKVKISIF